jgi:hypothetical protein
MGFQRENTRKKYSKIIKFFNRRPNVFRDKIKNAEFPYSKGILVSISEPNNPPK